MKFEFEIENKKIRIEIEESKELSFKTTSSKIVKTTKALPTHKTQESPFKCKQAEITCECETVLSSRAIYRRHLKSNLHKKRLDTINNRDNLQ